MGRYLYYAVVPIGRMSLIYWIKKMIHNMFMILKNVYPIIPDKLALDEPCWSGFQLFIHMISPYLKSSKIYWTIVNNLYHFFFCVCVSLYIFSNDPSFQIYPLLHNDAFWCLWNMYLKILWKMEHLLFWGQCSIFHNIFNSIQNLSFSWFFSILSKHRKWCQWIIFVLPLLIYTYLLQLKMT